MSPRGRRRLTRSRRVGVARCLDGDLMNDEGPDGDEGPDDEGGHGVRF